MLASILRAIAVVACFVVALSFALFAIDEARSGSKATTSELQREAGKSGAAGAVPVPPPRHDPNPIREEIDDANSALVSPFASAAPSGRWPHRLVELALALLLYGVGLGFLARYTAARS